MANARALDKRRKSIRNIRKITRTMELIATARFKKAMDRASSATDYTKRITQVVADLAAAGLEVSHPLLEPRPETKNATLLVLSANRGLCGGFNGNVIRQSIVRRKELMDDVGANVHLEVAGKRGISGLKFRKIDIAQSFLQFNDRPAFEEVDEIATRYMEEFVSGKMDRLDVVYTRFKSISRQETIVETLLPLGNLVDDSADETAKTEVATGSSIYEFVPDAKSILAEVVPASFKAKLFKCFLDSAVSEQIARMVAMKNATKSASDMIKELSRTYNRARQSQITGEIMEVIGGVEALSG